MEYPKWLYALLSEDDREGVVPERSRARRDRVRIELPLSLVSRESRKVYGDDRR